MVTYDFVRYVFLFNQLCDIVWQEVNQLNFFMSLTLTHSIFLIIQCDLEMSRCRVSFFNLKNIVDFLQTIFIIRVYVLKSCGDLHLFVVINFEKIIFELNYSFFLLLVRRRYLFCFVEM